MWAVSYFRVDNLERKDSDFYLNTYKKQNSYAEFICKTFI